MNESIAGIIHVHSSFSRDGACSIADLTRYAREAGFRFVALTDHAEDLSAAQALRLRAECEACSDESCVVIPGLEFVCSDDIHILGLGVSAHIPDSDPVRVAATIRAWGGLAIFAHPVRSNYQCPPALCGVLDGIEIWNARYDGRFVPAFPNFHLLQQARRSNAFLIGFGGPDFHRLDSPPEVITRLRVNGNVRVDSRTVLQHLRSGNFAVGVGHVRFNGRGGPRAHALFPLWALRKLYEISKGLRDLGSGNS